MIIINNINGNNNKIRKHKHTIYKEKNYIYVFNWSQVPALVYSFRRWTSLRVRRIPNILPTETVNETMITSVLIPQTGVLERRYNIYVEKKKNKSLWTITRLSLPEIIIGINENFSSHIQKNGWKESTITSLADKKKNLWTDQKYSNTHNP